MADSPRRPWIRLALSMASLIPGLAFGNGGTFANTHVEATGQLTPERKNRITLEREEMRVTFDGADAAEVSVTYHLHNRGGADTVRYGFPIDRQVRPAPGIIGRLQGVSDYRIEVGGRRLDVRQVLHEPGGEPTEVPYEARTRDWYLSDWRFQRGERTTVAVSYRTPTYATTSGTSKSFRWTRSDNTFRYSFRPAQTWGNGRVGALRVDADISALRQRRIPVTVVSPPGAVESNGILTWHWTDLDLRTAEDLVIRYDRSSAAEEDQIRPHRLDRRWIRSIRASSTLPPTKHSRYGVDNLLDGRQDTAWIEGVPGPGRGEWIEITFQRGVRVRGIGLLNGYTKSAATLAENGHVRSIELEATPRDASVGWGLSDLGPAPESALSPDWPVSALAWVLDAGESAQAYRTIRLQISDAVAGSKYADTAVSELFVYGWPPKE